jgi:hypothetical protein
MSVVDEPLDVRFTSVLSAERMAFPTVSLSCFEIAALAPYPGRSGANMGASECRSGIKWRHLIFMSICF